MTPRQGRRGEAAPSGLNSVIFIFKVIWRVLFGFQEATSQRVSQSNEE